MDTVDQVLGRANGLFAEGRVREAIELVTTTDRAHPDPRLAAASVQWRHEGFTRVAHPAPADPPGPVAPVAPVDERLREFGPAELTAVSYEAELAAHGCALVRELIEPEAAAALCEGIDRAFAAFDDVAAGGDRAEAEPWFRAFTALPEHGGLGVRRKFMRDAGGMWAVDSPRMFATLLELLERTGVVALVEEVIGERPALSANKCNLRRVPTDIPADWHQDGAFLGSDVRSANLWLALSPCGVDAPGLDLVPRRIPEVVTTGTEGANFDWSVAPSVVEATAGDAGVIRPSFAAGDALLFDHLFLHCTGLSPSMTQPRYAIECWFFAPSDYPEGQIPILL
jgi:hypothetical protein